MLTKGKLRRWYAEAFQAYQAGRLEVTEGVPPVGLANTLTAGACLERGRADATRRPKDEPSGWDGKLPLDLWQEVIARKLKPLGWY